ncbi:MAG: hypothetical protein AAFS07_08185 [Pseudomonadota bacterium]
MLLALAVVGDAGATEWSLGGRISQALSFETNRNLDEDGDPSFGATTTLNLVGGLTTDRASWTARSNLRFRFFTGDDEVDLFSPNVRVNGRVNGQTWQLNPFLRYRRNNVSFNDLLLIEGDDDIGDGDIGDDGDGGTGDSSAIIVDADATRTDVNLGSGLSLALSPRNSVAFSGSYALRRFSDDANDLEASDTFRFSGQVSRQVTPRTGLFVSGGLAYFQIDDVEETTSFSFSSTVGISRRVSERLAISASGGASVTSRNEDNPTPGDDDDDDTSVNGSGRFSIEYLEGDTRFTLGLSQSVSPSSDGDIRNRLRLRLGLRQPLDQTKTFSVVGAVTRSSDAFDDDGGGSGRIVGSISPQISYSVSEAWRANLRYTFRFGSDDDDSAISNGVFVTVSRPLSLY